MKKKTPAPTLGKVATSANSNPKKNHKAPHSKKSGTSSSTCPDSLPPVCTPKIRDHLEHLEWQRVPWHVKRQRGIKKNMKQTTLTSYPAFNRPGQEGNPLVIDSDDNTSNAVDCSSDIEFPNPRTSFKDAQQPSESGAIAQGSTRPSLSGCVGIQSQTLEKMEGTSMEPNPDASRNPTDPDFPASITDPTSKSSDSELPIPGIILKDSQQPSESEAIAQDSTRPSPTGCVGIQSKALEKLEGSGDNMLVKCASMEPNPDASRNPTDPDFPASIIDPTSKSSDSELPIPGTILKDSQQPSKSEAIAQDSTRSSPSGCDQIQSKALEKLEDTVADPEIDTSSKSTDNSLLAKIGDPSIKTSCSELPSATKDAQQASGLDRVVDKCSLGFPTGPDGLTPKGPGNPEGQEHTFY
ncbi:uncharacterized protein PGTG_20835 [Puccinia graminis f. sp. tritici CRL 75-36-700-3]|uniref:Uncharacterized protein n=1 Tax=Puccinia graminis f. sp. tritici (strain CRL 75-36-700-3 / race SCCL) TaxID=418459 RepID=H6QPN6_PUCGT|nr:uncharacterized protein PGTG_20835 [Puccinia graminis f. sp. tritici CRL 75-36-700-3]EHS64138.1 hypothetical protein PGTG_20835 [Puccinia graminis f. sp. tritici CRL 75-36-700-3]